MLDTKRRERRGGRLPWLLLFVAAAAVYVLFFWRLVNPARLSGTGLDSSCFYVIGNGILHGRMPYVDYLDNKGPVLYLLYALCAWVAPHPWGAWCMGIPVVFGCLTGVWMLCRRLGVRLFLLPCLLFLAAYTLICAEGGCTEDIALPFCIFSFVVLADYWQQDKRGAFRFGYGFWLGVLFWLCAMTRVNNAVCIAAVAVCIGVHLLATKAWPSFGKLVVSFLLASALVLTPILLWLLHGHALRECLDQTLLNNLKYNAAPSSLSKSYILLTSFFAYRLHTIAAICSVCVLICRKNTGKSAAFLQWSAAAIVAVTAATFLSVTQVYMHYLLVMLPPFTLCICLFFCGKAPRKERIDRLLRAACIALCCFAMILNFNAPKALLRGVDCAKDLVSAAVHHMPQSDWERRMREMMAIIPPQERDSVLPIDINPKIIALTDVDAGRRIFVCASLFTSISDGYAAEFTGYFDEDPPKWLVTQQPVETIRVCGLGERLAADYQLRCKLDQKDANYNNYYLYQLVR